MEPEFPELPHRIDHIAAQARRIVDEDEVEAARLAERHLDELLQPMTTFDTRASDGLIRIDVVVKDHPIRMSTGFLTAPSSSPTATEIRAW